MSGGSIAWWPVATGRLGLPARARLGLVRLRADRRGSAAVDFAIIGPALVVMMVGILEVAMLMMTQTLLQSAVADAARAGLTGQPGDGLTRAELVRLAAERVGGNLIDPGRLALETLVYQSFTSIGEPEPFTDVNSNGVHDAGEPFTDVNGNGSWDSDQGQSGLGGPNDIVLYRITYAWQPMTPFLRGLLPGDGTVELSASFAVRNEPFPEG